MKVLMIVGGYFPESCGGTEVFTQVLSEGLQKNKNIEVGVLCMYPEDKDEVVNGVKVFRRRIRVFPKWQKTYPVFAINKILHLYNPFNKKYIRKVYEKFKPDIIHIQMLRMISPAAVTVAKEMGIPVIKSVQELYSLWNFNPFKGFKDVNRLIHSDPSWFIRNMKKLHRKVYQYIDHIIAPSEFALREYEREGYFRLAKKEIIPCALDYDLKQVQKKYKERKKELQTPKKIKFLFVGRLVEEKGLDLLLDAFMSIKNKNIELYIAGDGPLKGFVQKSIKKDPRIRFLGFIYDEDKEKIFNQCHVMVLPSSAVPLFYETFGIVFLEANIHAMPSIGTNRGGTPEIVKNGKTGILITPNSLLDLKKAINFFSDSKNIIKMLDSCYENILNYSYNEMIDSYHEIYSYQIEKRIKNVG